MIKIEKPQVVGLEPAIRGMRNPKNSWEKSDSYPGLYGDEWSLDPGYIVGDADKDLMMRLAKGGPVHAKYRRMIVVYCDITAPLYWWKEFDTYKVGTVANSCSTMHKIADKPFDRSDFSWEHVDSVEWPDVTSLGYTDAAEINNYTYTELTIELLNYWRDKFNSAADERYKKLCWWQMIQLLPSSYNQKRTIMLNYEVLAGIYPMRKNHKLDEWHVFCQWIKTLPYSNIITMEN